MIKDSDFIGKKYGRITILEKTNIKNSNGSYMFKIKCDCGKILIKSKSTYSNNRFHNVGNDGCGCFGKIRIGNLNKLNKGEAAIVSIFSVYKNRAKILGLEFSLTKQEFIDLIFNNCQYCGSPPSNVKKSLNGNLLYNGIDRIDNNKGYTLENVESCCGICNKMKLTFHYQDFIAHINKIYKYVHRFKTINEARIHLKNNKILFKNMTLEDKMKFK